MNDSQVLPFLRCSEQLSGHKNLELGKKKAQSFATSHSPRANTLTVSGHNALVHVRTYTCKKAHIQAVL